MGNSIIEKYLGIHVLRISGVSIEIAFKLNKELNKQIGWEDLISYRCQSSVLIEFRLLVIQCSGVWCWVFSVCASRYNLHSPTKEQVNRFPLRFSVDSTRSVLGEKMGGRKRVTLGSFFFFRVFSVAWFWAVTFDLRSSSNQEGLVHESIHGLSFSTFKKASLSFPGLGWLLFHHY